MVPRGWPYAIFLLGHRESYSGRKSPLSASAPATVNQRMTRWLFNSAARLAYYRSYRDAGAKEAMRKRGLDVSR